MAFSISDKIYQSTGETASRGGYEQPLKKSLPYLKSNDFHLLLTLKKKFNTNIKTSKEAWNASDIKSMQKISLSRFLATFRAPINLFFKVRFMKSPQHAQKLNNGKEIREKK